MKKFVQLLCLFVMTGHTFLTAQENEGPDGVKTGSFGLISDLMYGGYVPYILNTSVDIGVFETLAGKSLTPKEVSANLKTKEVVTDALLTVLHAVKLLDFNDGKYSLAPVAATYLVKSSPDNRLDRLNANTVTVTGPMADLKPALTGQLKRPAGKGGPVTSPWQDKEHLASMKKRIDESGQIRTVTSFMEALPEFENCRKMIDFAGSIGYYALGILDKNPELKAHVYDLPEVCNIALELQKDEKNFDRVSFHGFDMRKNDPIGEGYDLFFVSNALYGQRAKDELVEFFKKANKSMVIGGVLVSNHWTNRSDDEGSVRMTITGLMQSFHGRPVHYIEENILKEALSESGFGNFTTTIFDKDKTKPVLLLAARKISNI